MNKPINTEFTIRGINRRSETIKNIDLFLSLIIIVSIIFFMIYKNEFIIHWMIVLTHAIIVFVFSFIKTENRLFIFVKPTQAMLHHGWKHRDVLKLGDRFTKKQYNLIEYLKETQRTKIQYNEEIVDLIDWKKGRRDSWHIYLNTRMNIMNIYFSMFNILISIIVFGLSDNIDMVIWIYVYLYIWRVGLIYSIDLQMIAKDSRTLIYGKDVINLYIYTRTFFQGVFRNYLSMHKLERFLRDFDIKISEEIVFELPEVTQDI